MIEAPKTNGKAPRKPGAFFVRAGLPLVGMAGRCTRSAAGQLPGPRGPPSSPLPLFRPHPQRAVEPDGRAVEHVVLDDAATSAAYSSGRPRREGNGMLASSALRNSSGTLQHRRLEQARHDGDDADAVAGEVARHRERQSDHAALDEA